MEFQQIIQELKKPFKPHQHKERKLPGGGRWFFIPWQDIRERLDEVYPEWSCTWSQPHFIGDYCHISCTITIAGVSRQAPGNAPIILLSNEGKDMARGTPIERATADAFKNAAEAFGVARYLDDQKLTVSIMHKQGDYRAFQFAKENEEIEAGARGIPIKKSDKRIVNTFAVENSQAQVITHEQVKRLWAIARNQYKLTDDDVRKALAKFGLDSTKNIPVSQYEAVMVELENCSPVNF